MCHFYELNIKTIEELKTITWRDTFDIKDIKKENLYHPIKSIDEQKELHTWVATSKYNNLPFDCRISFKEDRQKINTFLILKNYLVSTTLSFEVNDGDINNYFPLKNKRKNFS